MKTMTALFDDYNQAAQAVRALEAAGFPEDEISLVISTLDDEVGEDTTDERAAGGAGAGAGIGALIGGAGGLLAGVGALAIPGLGPVIAAGWLVSTAIGAVAGAALGGATGGVIGALTSSGIHEQDAHIFAEGVRRGGSVVSVRTDESRAGIVEDIFVKAEQVDIAERRARYEEEGWQYFDPTAPGFNRDRDRERHGLDHLQGPF
ncbi:hypothetical protein GCM10007913_04620 [Devosia yakushimensis]|uniref:General stress protein 17M-like domain-containing protein n=1 Tax=Devosia yakushimensis TaxID=470028 RepID=A0ABQ5UBH3_9HYPH|nr:general stress protein [Devosia yakushimensis]GLQ08530.1 hypothetical protein GCM10007913_04620 [Devosia yakushimensis]